MIKYIMILVFGLSLFLPVAVQAGNGPPPTVAIIKCCMADGDIRVFSNSANADLNDLPGARCRVDSTCAGCIQSILDSGLDLEQTNVEGMCSWYHFFDNDRRDFDR